MENYRCINNVIYFSFKNIFKISFLCFFLIYMYNCNILIIKCKINKTFYLYAQIILN